MTSGNGLAKGLIFSRKSFETLSDILYAAWHAVNIPQDRQNFQY